MSNTTGVTSPWTSPNYLGVLLKIGRNQTPFLTSIGGLNGAKQARSKAFACSQPSALNSPSQPAIHVQAARTAPTANVFVRGQVLNTCQIFQYKIDVDYSKMADMLTLTGLAVGGQAPEPPSEKDFQIQMTLEQAALDVEYTFINGVYQAEANVTTAAKTRGMLAAISTNAVAAGSAALTDAIFKQLLMTMSANGARFIRPVIHCNDFQASKFDSIYGFAPQDANVGGVAVQIVRTHYGNIPLVISPQMPTDTIMVADEAYCAPVVNPIPGKPAGGVLFYEELSRTGATEAGQIYGHIGLDYSHELLHGKITGLATS